MKIFVKSKDFIPVLEDIRNVTESRQALPSASMFLVRHQEKSCSLTAMNSEVEMCRSSNRFQVENPEPALLPAKKTYDIIKNLPSDSVVNLEFGENCEIAVSSGRNRFKLLSVPFGDFPLIDEDLEISTKIVLRQDDLKNMLLMVACSMANNDARYYLNGMYFESEDTNLIAVATDGHRLARSQIDTKHPIEGKTKIIIPRRAVTELQRTLKDSEEVAEITVGPKNFKVEFGEVSLTTKTINGQFPDYRRVIPTRFNLEAKINRKELLCTLMKTSAIALDNTRSGTSEFHFAEGQLKLTATNQEGEEAVVEQEIEYTGEAVTIGFNPTYLVDVMTVLDAENILLQIRDASSGVRIVAEGSETEEYIVMPLRL